MKIHRLALITQALVLLIVGAALAQDTTAPVVSAASASPAMAAPGDVVHIVAQASDDTGITGIFADSTQMVSTDVNRWECDIPASPVLGTHNVTITASDAAGNVGTDTSAVYTTTRVFGIRCSNALSPVLSSFTSTSLFKVWGLCTYIDADSFWIDDGSTRRVKVISADHFVCNGDYVVAHGRLDSRAAPATIYCTGYEITVPGPREQITISDTTVGKDLMTPMSGYLPYTVQYGSKLDVMISSSDPSKVTLAKTADSVGSASIVVTVNGGSSALPTFYVHGLANSGVVNVLATAKGGLGKQFHVTLAPSGMIIYTPSSISTTSFSSNTTISVRSVRLDPASHAYSTIQPLRPGIDPVTIPISISDPSVGTITATSLTISGGESSALAEFDPINAGTATISIGAVAGFTTPSNRQSINATVTAADISAYDVTVGRDLQIPSVCYLQVAPPEPVDMTVSVDSPSVATLTTDPTVEGASSVTFSGVSNTNGKTFYVQGRSIGTTTLTIQAVGYNTVHKTIKVDPSGFIIYTPSSISTTSFSANTQITIKPVRLTPDTLAYSTMQNLRGGMADVVVPISVSDTTVGVVTASTVTIGANTTGATTEFDPLNAGATTISIGTAEGFTTPSNKQSINATVTAADINAYDIIVGRDLQTSSICYLQVAPPAPVDMTVSVDSPSVATLTTDPAVEGSSSVTFNGVSNTNSRTFYVQGRSIGTAVLTVQAAGYNTVRKTITVDPSGFIIYTPSSINTTNFSANTAISIKAVRLDPNTLMYSTTQNLRGGMADVTVPVAISDETVGTLSAQSVVVSANTGGATVDFDPIAVGNAAISITAPDGFYVPSNRQVIPVSVVVPAISAGDVNVGLDLQTPTSCYLQVAPLSPVDVTIEVSSTDVATITTNPSIEGIKSLTFHNIATTAGLSFTVQGRTLGTTSLTISAPGYETMVKAITVDPSGFVIYSPGNITTNTTAGNTELNIRPAKLNPVNFTYTTAQNLRGGLSVSVDVVSSNAGVGVITASPLIFDSNTSSAKTQFDPLAAGTCTLSVVPPDGFSTPTTRREIDATVNP